VAVGLFRRFSLEPLEASAIVMIELSAKSIANLLPSCHDGMRQAARLFNDTFRYRWERIVDFPQVALRAESTHRLSILDRQSGSRIDSGQPARMAGILAGPLSLA